jgi:hypothetical protein
MGAAKRASPNTSAARTSPYATIWTRKLPARGKSLTFRQTVTGAGSNCMDYYTAYKEIRNRLRKFKPTSVIARALEVLWQPAPNQIEELKRAPWQVLLLIKWALLDEEASDVHGQEMPMQVFDDIRQRLWELPERVDMVRKGAMPLRLFMRRMLYQQVEFQRRITPSFVRQPAILADLQSDHALRSLFRRKAGLDVLDFLDLGLAAHGPILDKKAQFARAWFEPLGHAYGNQTIDAFLRCVSLDYLGMTGFVRGLRNAQERKASEYFDFTPLKRFPFLFTRGMYQCWHPMVFLRGMEDFAHLLMSEAGSDYVERFSKVFERHIVAEISRTGRHHYDEDALQKVFGNDLELPDAAIPMGSFNIIVEAKAGLFDDSMMAIADPEIFRHKTKALAKAIQQGWSASLAFRSEHAPADLRKATEDYLFVVTNKPLNVGSGADLKAIYPPGQLAYPSAEARALLPLERMYFISVDEFERLIASSADAPLLHSFLRESVRLDADPRTSKFFFGEHLRTFTGLKESMFLTKALEESHSRIARILKT